MVSVPPSAPLWAGSGQLCPGRCGCFPQGERLHPPDKPEEGLQFQQLLGTDTQSSVAFAALYSPDSMLEPPDDLPCQRPIVDNDAAIENVSIRSYRSGKGEVFRRMLLNGPEFAPVRTALSTMYVVFYERCRYCTLAVATRAPYSACRWRRR